MNGSIHRTGTGRWSVRWRDPDGRGRSRTFDNKRDAVDFQARVRRATGVGLSPLAETRSEPLRDALADFLERSRGTLRPRTWSDYERLVRLHISPDLGRRPLSGVSHSDVVTLLRSQTDANARKLRSILNQVFTAAVADGVCRLNPVDGIRLRGSSAEPRLRRRDVLSFDDVAAIAQVAPSTFELVIRFAAASGLRFGEIAGLAPTDVDPIAREVYVNKQWCGVSRDLAPPKSRAAYRTAVYGDPVAAEIEALTTERQGSPILFATAGGTRLSNTNFNNRVWRPSVAATGYAGYTFHDLRHTYASMLIRGGVNVALVSRLMGHSSPQVTLDVYSGVFADDIERARRALA